MKFPLKKVSSDSNFYSYPHECYELGSKVSVMLDYDTIIISKINGIKIPTNKEILGNIYYSLEFDSSKWYDHDIIIRIL